MSNRVPLLVPLGGISGGITVPPLVRPPLPPYPPGEYQKVLPYAPPPRDTRDFLRGNTWAVTVPGLPFVPGGSSEHPERFLTWFLDRWTPEWQHTALEAYVGRQYRHLTLSYADSTAPTNAGPPPGAGQTMAQFKQTCQLVKSYGLYCHVMLASKVYQRHDMSSADYLAWARPILSELMDAGCVDETSPGWEWNLFNIPGPNTVECFRGVGELAHSGGVSCWLHFSPHVTSWFADGDDRGRYGFYDDVGDTVDGLDYQGGAYDEHDTSVPPELRGQPWTIPDLQARLVDTLSQFGRQGNRHKMRLWEDVAIYQFSGDKPDEDDGDLRGYCACCTTDVVAGTSAVIHGYGNGGRMPDGSPL